MNAWICIDAGGTYTKYGLLDEAGTILSKGEMPAAKTREEFFAQMEKIARLYPGAKGISLSAPGRIDRDTGWFYTGGALYYLHDLNVAEEISRRTGLPCVVQNDAKAAAQAELWQGVLQGEKEAVLFVLGTGLGGAVIMDGRLQQGQTMAAGEFSWILAEKDGKLTGLADLTCTPALLKLYEERTGERVDGRQLFERLEKGDPDAQSALQEYAANLARAVLTVQAVTDAGIFVLGGGISSQDTLIQAVNEAADQLYETLPFWCPLRKPEIKGARFRADANLIGALAHALEKEKAA